MDGSCSVYLRGSQILYVFIVHCPLRWSESDTESYQGQKRWPASSFTCLLPLQGENTGMMWLCSCCCCTPDWPERFHAGFTWLVSNTLHKSWCLQACVVLETDKGKDIISQSCLQMLPLFLIHETVGTNAIGHWVGEKLLITIKVVEDIYSKEPPKKTQW